MSVTKTVLSSPIENGATFKVPYPSGTSLASNDFETGAVHEIVASGAVYTGQSVSLGATSITVTNGTGRTLRTGEEVLVGVTNVVESGGGAGLEAIATGNVLANISGASAVPIAVPIADFAAQTVLPGAASYTVTNQSELDALVPKLLASRWYNPLVTSQETMDVVVNLSGRGPYALTLINADLGFVEFTGEPDILVSVTSIQATGATVGRTTTVTLQLAAADLSGVVAGDWFSGDFLTAGGSETCFSGGTNPKVLAGAWQITAVDDVNNRIGVKLIHATAAQIGAAISLPSGAVSGPGKIVRTKLALSCYTASAGTKDCNLTQVASDKGSYIRLYAGSVISGAAYVGDQSNLNTGLSAFGYPVSANYSSFLRNDSGSFCGDVTDNGVASVLVRNNSSATIEGCVFHAGSVETQRSSMAGLLTVVLCNMTAGLKCGDDCSMAVLSDVQVVTVSCPSKYNGETLDTRQANHGVIYIG